MSTTPPPFPDPPQTAADHFRTAEMHAACALTLLKPDRVTEDPIGRADRLAQFDGHMALARLHTELSATLIAAVALADVENTGDEVVAWTLFLEDRVERHRQYAGEQDQAARVRSVPDK